MCILSACYNNLLPFSIERFLVQDRDANLKTIQSLEAKLQQEKSSQKMQMDRANERLKNYERALFDTRQVLAMKDAKIAKLESGQPLSSARSASSDNGSAGYASTPPPQAAYNSVPLPRDAPGSHWSG